MPKNKVNNNIKLKSGGGIINDATDGLSVDSGTTANKLVQLDGSAKLPAVDGSQLTGLPTSLYQQFLPTVTKSYNGNPFGRVYFATVDSEYSLYVIGGEASPERYFTLYRFVLDSATKQYKLSWSKNVDGGGSGQKGLYGCTVLGDYVYFVGYGASIRRVDKATGTNEVTMTVSGANVYTYEKGLVNDGTYIYMLRGESSAYPIQKFSVSGTTLTFISEKNTNTGNLHYISFVKDGFAYSFYRGDSSGTYKKINLATGAVSDWTPGTAGITCNTGTMTFYSTRFSGDTMLTVSLNGTGSGSTYLPASSVVSFSTVTAF